MIAPLIEFTDTLIFSSSNDLDIQTFKVTDQISGKQMGIRLILLHKLLEFMILITRIAKYADSITLIMFLEQE